MVPVATERLIASHQTFSGELTDEELEEEEVAAAWAADVLQFPSSLEVDIRVHKGAEPLGKNQQVNICWITKCATNNISPERRILILLLVNNQQNKELLAVLQLW